MEKDKKYPPQYYLQKEVMKLVTYKNDGYVDFNKIRKTVHKNLIGFREKFHEEYPKNRQDETKRETKIQEIKNKFIIKEYAQFITTTGEISEELQFTCLFSRNKKTGNRTLSNFIERKYTKEGKFEETGTLDFYSLLLNFESYSEAKVNNFDITNKPIELLKNDNFLFYKKGKSLQLSNFLLGKRFTNAPKIPYLKREIDDKIFDSLSNNESFVINAQPLSGKTRAIYELLKNKDFENYIVVKPKFTATELDFKNCLNVNKNFKHIFFLDDINEYFSNSEEDFNITLSLLIERSQIIIGTVKSGLQYEAYNDDLKQSNIDYYIEEFTIEQLSKNEIMKNFSHINWENFDWFRFNGTIGSLLLDLKEMIRRYEKLKKSESLIDARGYGVLNILKVFYIMQNYEIANSYDISRLLIYYNQKNKTTIDNFNFKIILRSLQRINFVELDEIEEIVFIEPVYFSFINNKLTIKKCFIDIDKVLPSAELKKKNGFYLGVKKLNNMVYEKLYWFEIESILERFEFENVNKNTKTYNNLLKRAEDEEHASKLFEEMDKKGIKKSYKSYLIYLTILKDQKKINTLIDEVYKKGLLKSAKSYNSYFYYIKDEKKATIIWNEMESKGVKIYKDTYTIYFFLINDKTKATKIWEEMDGKGISKHLEIYVLYLEILNGKEKVTNVSGEFCLIFQSWRWDNIDNLEKLSKVWKDINDKDLHISDVCYYDYISLLDEKEKSINILEEMVRKGKKKDYYWYYTYMLYIEDEERAIELWKEMDRNGIKKDYSLYYEYLSILKDVKEETIMLDNLDGKWIERI